MKIKTFKPSDCRLHQRAINRTSLNISKFGLFSFNRKAVEELHLAAGMTLVFIQDIERPQDWYVTHEADGFILRRKNFGQLCFNSGGLRTKIIESLKEKPAFPSVSFMLSTEPLQDNGRMLYAIITSKAL